MSQFIEGTFYRSGTAKSSLAQLELSDDRIRILIDNVEQSSARISQVKFSDAIPGIATEIYLANGDLFIPSDKHWRLNKQNGTVASFLESNPYTVIASIILAPLLIYWLIMVAMPAIASKSVDWLPPNIAHYMGEQSFSVLDETFLASSELDKQTKVNIETLFEKTLDSLSLDNQKYQIFIRKSDYFGANALALPNGTVIVTDRLITQLKSFEENYPTSTFESMLTAIVLHEIGHLEAKHSLRLVAQSLSNAIVFALLLGDLETVGELMVGASSALIQANFSRDMENEADEFALRNLKHIGFDPLAFADAMASFQELNDGTTQSLIQYLSSHPAIKERIDNAKQFNKSN